MFINCIAPGLTIFTHSASEWGPPSQRSRTVRVGPRRHHHTACKNAVTVCDDLTIVFDRLRYELFTELRGPTELPDERGRLPDKPAVCEMLKKHITKLGKDAVTVLQGKEEAGEEVRGVNAHTRSRTLAVGAR